MSLLNNYTKSNFNSSRDILLPPIESQNSIKAKHTKVVSLKIHKSNESKREAALS